MNRRTLLKSSLLIFTPFKISFADGLNPDEQEIVDFVNTLKPHKPRLWQIHDSYPYVESGINYAFIYWIPGKLATCDVPKEYAQQHFGGVHFPSKPSLDWNKINRAAGYQVCLFENLLK